MTERRLIFLDALRGFFILYVIWLHAMNGVVFNNNPEALKQAPVWLLIVFAPIAILATWAPIFAVISGTAHAYVLHSVMTRHHREHKAQHPFRPFLSGALTTTLFLSVLSMFNMGFMHHSMPFNGAVRHTLFTSSLQRGEWVPFDVNLLFYNDALSMVAVNTFLVSLILYLVWRGNGFLHPRRYTLILGGLAALVFAASPLVHMGLDPVFSDALNAGQYGKAFALKLLVGPNLSPMPYLAYGLMGAIIGIGLARRVPARTMRRYGFGFAAVIVACGVVLLIMSGFKPVELVQHPLPFKLHCINLGLMLGCCTLLVLAMEYCHEDKRRVIARRTLWLRRVGMAALTLFCLESFSAILFSKGYMALLGIDGAFPRSPYYVVPFLAFLLIFWNLFLMLYEKADFRFSVEWWLSQLVCWVRGRPSVRLQAHAVLHQPCEAAPPRTAPAPVASK